MLWTVRAVDYSIPQLDSKDTLCDFHPMEKIEKLQAELDQQKKLNEIAGQSLEQAQKERDAWKMDCELAGRDWKRTEDMLDASKRREDALKAENAKLREENQALKQPLGIPFWLQKAVPKYREPTSADVGRDVEVRCHEFDRWITRKLLAVIDWKDKFLVQSTKGFPPIPYHYARVKDDR